MDVDPITRKRSLNQEDEHEHVRASSYRHLWPNIVVYSRAREPNDAIYLSLDVKFSTRSVKSFTNTELFEYSI